VRSINGSTWLETLGQDQVGWQHTTYKGSWSDPDLSHRPGPNPSHSVGEALPEVAFAGSAATRILWLHMAAAPLVPELYCSDLERSVAFYVGVLGFIVAYERPEERFVYLQREGAELMLEQPTGRTFLAADLEHPYGRGINLQIEVTDVASLYAVVQAAAWPVFLQLETRWYRRDAVLLGNRQFVVQDPDGYLLRFFEDLGSRPAR